VNGKLFWFGVGVLAYWGFQHFTGMGNTGKAKAAG
jgi:hypothetical protein